MRGAAPVGTGLKPIGIAEGDVDAGKLLVLQKVAHDPGETYVGSDREFTNSIRIGMLPHVFANVGREPGFRSFRPDQTAALDHEAYRRRQHAVLLGVTVSQLIGRK